MSIYRCVKTSLVGGLCLCMSCQQVTPLSASRWASDSTAAAEEITCQRIIPTRPLLDPPPAQATWTEFRQRSDGVHLMILSSEQRTRALQEPSKEEPLFVVCEGTPARKFRAVRMAGGQTWLCSLAMTRYVAEQLCASRDVMLYRADQQPWCSIPAEGFPTLWDTLQKTASRSSAQPS